MSTTATRQMKRLEALTARWANELALDVSALRDAISEFEARDREDLDGRRSAADVLEEHGIAQTPAPSN